jgi:hypothetical protein
MEIALSCNVSHKKKKKREKATFGHQLPSSQSWQKAYKKDTMQEVEMKDINGFTIWSILLGTLLCASSNSS